MTWKKVKLGEVCTITKGETGILKAIAGEYPMVVTGEERKSHNQFQFDDEAVIVPLVSGTGHGHASIKRIHFQAGKFALGSILCAIIPKDKTQLLAEYVYRFLDLNREKELVARMKGMANVTLPIKEIAQIEMPLPSLEAQAAFINMYKNLEKNSQQISSELSLQLSLLKSLRQQLLQDAVQGKLVPQDETEGNAQDLLAQIKAEKAQLIKDKKLKKEKDLPPITAAEIPFEIPDNWVWCRLGEIGKIKIGSTPSRHEPSFWKGNIPWVSSGEVANNFIYDTKEKITKVGFDNTSLSVYPKGSVLVAMIGQGKTRGQTSILKIDAATNQNVAGIIIEHTYLLSEFLWYFFLSRYEITRESASGGNQPALNGTKINNTLFPFPPLSEQIRIVKKLDELMQTCDALTVSIKQSASENEQLLQQVLREALEAR